MLAILIDHAVQFTVNPRKISSDGSLFACDLPKRDRNVISVKVFKVRVARISDAGAPPSILLAVNGVPNCLRGPESQAAFLRSFRRNVVTDRNCRLSTPDDRRHRLYRRSITIIIRAKRCRLRTTACSIADLLTVMSCSDAAHFI